MPPKTMYTPVALVLSRAAINKMGAAGQAECFMVGYKGPTVVWVSLPLPPPPYPLPPILPVPNKPYGFCGR